MTIRYQCPECESVLKIRDDKAGTEATCPGCKSKFTVPPPASASEAEPPEPVIAAKKPDGKRPTPEDKEKTAKKAAKAPVKTSKPSDSDDFDPAAFLMEDGPGAKASAGLKEKPPEPQGPLTDKQGRRLYTPASTSAARRASMSPAALAADENLSGASANARDLLRTTADESRVRAASMPPQEEKPPLFDFAGAKEELKQYTPHIAGSLVFFLVLSYFVYSWLNPRPDLPKLAEVTGVVTVNGQPLPNVTVNFEPIDAIADNAKEGPKRIRTAQGVTDKDGYYELYYMQGISGAPVGKGRIYLVPNSAIDVKKIPGEYAGRGTKIFEVREAGNQGRFDITIVE